VIRRVLDQPRRVHTRAVVGGDPFVGVGLALQEDIVIGVLEFRDLDEAEVGNPLEAVTRIGEIGVCQHPCHHTVPDVDSRHLLGVRVGTVKAGTAGSRVYYYYY
jgi:hypothetical protein